MFVASYPPRFKMNSEQFGVFFINMGFWMDLIVEYKQVFEFV